MDKRRDEIGKVLACLAVSRPGVCDIRSLERDYYEFEGKKLPFKDFGYSSTLDFIRSVSNHVRVEPRSGTYVIFPVVTDKIKHVNALVSRQKSGKRQTSGRRRMNRISQYYPQVREPKPFIPNTVQKEVARILTQNPSGVNKSYIAQCLEQSKSIPGRVNVNNIDDYLSGMPYTAYAHGNMVYPHRSLISTTNNDIADIDGFDIVTPGYSERCNEGEYNNTPDMNCTPGGAEDDEEIYEADEFTENTQPQSFKSENNRQRISSAEFIDRARARYGQPEAASIDNNNVQDYYENGAEVEDADNCLGNAKYTSESDDDGSLDIISPRLKSRLQQIIQKHPDGLWCANLLQAYSDEYKVPLDYEDLGFRSVCEFASHLPKIFNLYRQSSRGDFMLYDATKPLPLSAVKPETHSSPDVWEDAYNDEDIDPFPMTLPLVTSQTLVPNGVMTHGESVGQERIPDISPGPVCMLEIYVVEVYTPSLFWIHLRKQRSKLSQLMESMHHFYQEEGDNYMIPHVILEKGLNCVCTFEDKWHRAIIKTVKPDGDVTLVFYDYGTTKTYPPDALRFLVRQYTNLPAQAIACGLYNVKPINADAWTRGASSEFYSKVADLPLIAIVVKVDKDNNSMLVSLVDTQTNDDDHINDWLVRAGLAESGFMGDTVDLECSYLEDQITQAQDVIASSQNVPLVSPQSTLPESSGSTLKPPPGFTKPSEPMNYAAFMDDWLHGKGCNSTEMANSTFMNSSSVNLNSNPLAALNAMYNPLVPQPEALIQFWKQRLQIELTAAVNQFLLSNNSALLMNNTVLNNSSTVSPATSTNLIAEKAHSNPFKDCHEDVRQECSTIENSLEKSTDNLMNLSINEFNNTNLESNKTLPNFETLPSLSGRDSNLLGSDKPDLFSSKPMEGFATDEDRLAKTNDYESIDETYLNKTQSKISRKTLVTNGTNIVNDEEFIGQQLPDTNPFKQHVIGGFDSEVESRKEQSAKRNFEHKNVNKPPIPPRNPNLINNTGNMTTNCATGVTHNTSPVFNNSQQKIPTTKIYYKADPVMYNLRTDKTSETKRKLDSKTTKLSDSVSFRDNNHYNFADSSQDLTNHSLYQNTLFEFGKTNTSPGDSNSLQPDFHSQFNTAQTNNIFNSSTNFLTNHTPNMSPRILSNSYRPPPPPYNEKTSTEYLNTKKSPISPRFTSPLMSENSKAAIEEIQSATESNYFDKLNSVISETPKPTKRGTKLQNSDTREEHTSSSSMKNTKISSAKTTSKSSSNFQNPTRSHTSYKINLILPKFLQEEQSTISLKQELPDTCTKELEETSGITLSFEKVTQNLVVQAQSSPMIKENNTKLPWSGEHQEFCNLNGNSSKTSERLSSYQNSSETETGNLTTKACEGLHTRTKNNSFSPTPTLHNSQTLVNEQNLFKQNYNNSDTASKGGSTVDNNRLQFSNTEHGNTAPKNIPYPYQSHGRPLIKTQPFAPLYPNIVHLQHGQNYPHHMSPPDVQHPQIGQRIPLFTPNMHRFYPPAPHWPRPQFFNPAFPHAPINGPPFPQRAYPWNPHNPYMFVHKQTDDKPKMTIPTEQKTSQTDSNMESVQIIGKENNGNIINTIENKQTLSDVSEVKNQTTDHIHGRLKNSHSNFASNLENNTSPKQKEKLVEENTASTQGLNDVQVLAVLLARNDPEKLSNGNVDDIPQCTQPQVINKVFKPVELNKQTIYLFNIENEGWVCTDEIALTFTPYENHNMILRLLELVSVRINFKEVSRAQSPLLFAELDSTTIRAPRMTNSKRIKGILHLTPLTSLIRMMYYLKVISVEEIICSPIQKQLPPGSRIPELVQLVTAYKRDDEYWVT